MASSDEQSERTIGPGRRSSAATRQRLLRAAAELIAQVGWGRVTTRAVAARAELPHGAVSYHFAGKQELLTEAALGIVEQVLPISELQAVPTLADLLALITARLGEWDTRDPVLSGVVLEAMRESARDPVLRTRMAALGREYRRLVAELVRADRPRRGAGPDPAPTALATLIVAASDGLLLHAFFDPELDIADAHDALRALVSD